MTTLSIQLDETIEVARDAASCFAFVADFSTVQDWDPGVAAAERTTAGPIGVGSRFEVTIASGPWPFTRRFPMHYVVREHDPPQRLVLEGTSKQVDGVDTITFEPLGEDKTRIRYRADLRIKGLPGITHRWMRPAMRRMGRRAVDGLRAALTPDDTPQRSTLREVGDTLLVPGLLRFTTLGAGRQAIADRLDGQTVLLTGPTSGLGEAAAHRLAGLGARLILVGRSAAKLHALETDLRVAWGDGVALRLETADLSLVSEIDALLSRLRDEPQIDVLINNAGALFNTRGETAEGIEQTLAVDLLAPALLCEGLRAQLAAAPRGRVVNVVSGGLYAAGLSLEDLEYKHRRYDGTKAYAQAKRGLLALGQRWANAWAADGIAVHTMHPGWADTPGVEDALPGFHKAVGPLLRSPDAGADTIVWLAACPAAHGANGRLWLDRKPHRTAVLPNTDVDKETAAALLDRLHDLAAGAR